MSPHARAALTTLLAASTLVVGCAQGRATGDAGLGARDASSPGTDAAFVFPDAVAPDAGGLADLDAGALDAGGASPDALVSPFDAGVRVDAFVPTSDASARDAGADGGRPDAWSCGCVPGGACTTTCGTTGARTCSPGCVASCAPPAESCNAADDDCDGVCDEDVGACRASVVRAYHDSLGGHFYTRDRDEAISLGFRIEAEPFFAVYPSAQPGLAPLHRCFLGGAHRLYTLDAGCEGSGAVYEGVLGHVATSPTCGARPLYRLSARDDHFYATDPAERDYAVSIGYVDEGIAAYVW
jgi:hypothetical protein